MRFTWQLLSLFILALMLGAALILQNQVTQELQGERKLLREQNRDVSRLRTENKRLVAEQVSETELANLRSDREAVIRLRGEVEAWKAKISEMERNAKP